MRRDEGREATRDGVARPVQSVTSAPQSGADDQAGRIRRYLLTMGIRVACCALAIVATGWLRWTFVVGAVLLPYIAVVLANAVGPRAGGSVAPVDHQPDELRAIPVAPVDEAGRTIHGRVLDD